MRTNIQNINTDFTCKQCGRFVSANPVISGVVNRNHCPYCLYSRHLDLFEAGDRLCACKALMAPVGITVKHSRDKYTHAVNGELMLAHRCKDCNTFSINRIAADDDPFRILAVLCNADLIPDLKEISCQVGIHLLGKDSLSLVKTRLFGVVHEPLPAEIY